jgi:hypothetical protein
MAELARINIPSQAYPSGERTLGPVDVPRRVDALRVELTRAAVTGLPTLIIVVETLVGGQWRPAGGITTSCVVGPSWSGPGDPPAYFEARETGGIQATQVRARATLSGGSARIAATIIALED